MHWFHSFVATWTFISVWSTRSMTVVATWIRVRVGIRLRRAWFRKTFLFFTFSEFCFRMEDTTDLRFLFIHMLIVDCVFCPGNLWSISSIIDFSTLLCSFCNFALWRPHEPDILLLFSCSRFTPVWLHWWLQRPWPVLSQTELKLSLAWLSSTGNF